MDKIKARFRPGFFIAYVDNYFTGFFPLDRCITSTYLWYICKSFIHYLNIYNMKIYTETDLISFGNHMVKKYKDNPQEYEGDAVGVWETDIINWRKERDIPPIMFEPGQEIEIKLPIGVTLTAE